MTTLPRTLRSLQRAPGFVAIATLSLGAALGLSTSVFALIDAMRHPASPYRDVDQLYLLNLRLGTAVNPNRRDVDQALSGMTGVIAHASSRFANTTVEFGDGVERTGVAFTHSGFVDILGVRPRALDGFPPPPSQPERASHWSATRCGADASTTVAALTARRSPSTTSSTRSSAFSQHARNFPVKPRSA